MKEFPGFYRKDDQTGGNRTQGDYVIVFQDRTRQELVDFQINIEEMKIICPVFSSATFLIPELLQFINVNDFLTEILLSHRCGRSAGQVRIGLGTVGRRPRSPRS